MSELCATCLGEWLAAVLVPGAPTSRRRSAASPLPGFEDISEPIFATDEKGSIIGLSRGAERLLGREAAEVLGKPCHEVASGWDIFGNRFCRENCNLHEMIRRREPLHGFRLDLWKPPGEMVRVDYSTSVVRSPSSPGVAILHRLAPSGEPD